MNTSLNLNIPSPIQAIELKMLAEHGINLFVKREDLIHETISGNKWRKLKYNLLEAKETHTTIVTFGGAFSNHIYSTAAACNLYNLSSIGIIRGEYDEHNPTLQFVKSRGMKLHYIDRSSYRDKENSPAAQKIISSYDNPLIIPEGGSNATALKGIKELAIEINEANFDIVMVSAGTGHTAAGLLKFLNATKTLWVFSSLKSDYLKEEILRIAGQTQGCQYRFIDDSHFGGYGKTSSALINSMNSFTQETRIPLDPVYNGKLISGFLNKVRNGVISNSSTYLWIHTGGLQGIDAYNYMANKKSKSNLLLPKWKLD